MIGTVSILVFAFSLLSWMWWFELRLARTLDMAEGTCDQADRALGWITDHAAPAIERIAAIAPELADVLVTHRAILEGLPERIRHDFPEPIVIEAATVGDPVPDPQQPPTEPELPVVRRPRPSPGPKTKPDGLPANRGVKKARLTAATDIDRDVAEASFEHDAEYAHGIALVEDHMWAWEKYRDSLEWAR